jgi:hypothetical protein
MAVREGRWTVELEGDFVVFIIGARVGNPLKAVRALPLLGKMSAMLKEIEGDPAHGLLAVQRHGGPFGVIVQYWRSFEALEAYARNPLAQHRPVWQAWFRAGQDKNAGVGIWHETYKVGAGQYEAIYQNMGDTGLLRAGTPLTVGEAKDSARKRLGA